MVVLLGPHNARVKQYAALKKRAERERQGRILVEGLREVMRALEAGLRPEVLLLGPEEDEAILATLLGPLGARHPVLRLSERALERISSREHPAPVAAVFPAPHRDLRAVSLSEQAILLVLAGLEKPGNVGAILRTADAVGVELVLATGGVDVYSPQVIRNSTGAVFTVPVVPLQEEEALHWIRSQGIRLVAAHPEGTSLYWDVDLRGPVAFVLGAEDVGLSEFWLRAADQVVRIPMRGIADSLNVSVSAALLLYEALRQRRRPDDVP
jgi:TrmH family RNA methyltransferase|nr:MAG: 23S rRNA methyltransferase [Bacteroidota bacterium]